MNEKKIGRFSQKTADSFVQYANEMMLEKPALCRQKENIGVKCGIRGNIFRGTQHEKRNIRIGKI